MSPLRHTTLSPFKAKANSVLQTTSSCYLLTHYTLSGFDSPIKSKKHLAVLCGASEGNRTPNLLITSQLLYRWATLAYVLCAVNIIQHINQICQTILAFFYFIGHELVKFFLFLLFRFVFLQNHIFLD